MIDPNRTVGVVVGRFQVDSLHQGHTHLLSTVANRHRRVLIVLGTTARRNARDPLDFTSRESMLRAAFPQATIVPLRDRPGDDKGWSKDLDKLISSVYPGIRPILYGARGSFLPHYTGRFETREIEDGPADSGSDRRAEVAASWRDSQDFRAGQIHALSNAPTPWYPCVDIAILRADGNILLGQKEHEVGTEQYRFVGGMVDDDDPSLEYAAKRELAEETGLEIDGLEQVATHISPSTQIPGTCVITTLFTAQYVFGSPYNPKDDIAELTWHPLRWLRQFLIPTHQPLGVALLETRPALGAPCSTLCTGFRYHQAGCPHFRSGEFREVPPMEDRDEKREPAAPHR